MIYLFSLHNQLPRIFEVANAIIITVEPTVLSYRKGIPESLNRQSVINSCAENLKRLSKQSFGTNFIKTIRTIFDILIVLIAFMKLVPNDCFHNRFRFSAHELITDCLFNDSGN